MVQKPAQDAEADAELAAAQYPVKKARVRVNRNSEEFVFACSNGEHFTWPTGQDLK